ncbi:kinesin heavy chain, putative, partial [Perkinsus marinus ATCC 50983]
TNSTLALGSLLETLFLTASTIACLPMVKQAVAKLTASSVTCLGIPNRSISHVAQEEEKHEGKQLCVTVSFLEIYNEQLRDLLDPQTIPDAIALQRRSSPSALKPPSPGKARPNTPPPPSVMVDELIGNTNKKKKLFIHQHPTKGVFVPNLTEAACGSLDECLSFLNLGLKQRATAQTNMNSQSSRSHSVFTIRLRKRLSASQREHRTSSVHLIDLAGSERTKRSGAVGQRMKEGQSINTSLSVLGQVISKLSTTKASSASHIPFRQSKLTYLLTDALTGNSHTCMLAAVSPARHDQEETLSTLRFASSVKKIKTVRAVPSGCNLGSS